MMNTARTGATQCNTYVSSATHTGIEGSLCAEIVSALRGKKKSTLSQSLLLLIFHCIWYEQHRVRTVRKKA